MKPGQSVREKVTGRIGVVLDDGRVLFPSLAGNLNLNGTTDDGVRDIPEGMLEDFEPEIKKIIEVIADVLQAQGPEVHAASRL